MLHGVAGVCHSFLHPASPVPGCKGPQEQQLLDGEESFHSSLDFSGPGGQKPSEPPLPLPQAADAVGEILLSLSYLPTAERLTVVVVKAKNLIWTNDKTTAGKALLDAWRHHVTQPCVMGTWPLHHVGGMGPGIP